MRHRALESRPRARCLVLLVAAIFVVAPLRSSAQCITPPEAGLWHNINVNTNSIPQIELTFICQDQILNGQPYPPGPPWYVHVWGRCHPTNCDWGNIGAQRLSTGWIFAYYNQGFARRYVWARMSQLYPGKLYVYIWTDFVDPNRADYAVSNWFTR